MNFISNSNTYEFDSIDFKDNLIALTINSQPCAFHYTGDVVFFKDGNGVGDSWIDFSHDITLELVHEWSDENITLLDINEDYVVEWIAERTYLDMEKYLREYVVISLFGSLVCKDLWFRFSK